MKREPRWRLLQTVTCRPTCREPNPRLAGPTKDLIQAAITIVLKVPVCHATTLNVIEQ